MNGTWTLEVATPFGTHPATLIFERDAAGGGALRGRIRSQLGDAALAELRTAGESFTAIALLTLQGRQYEARIEGHVEGEHHRQLSGTISVKLPFAPKIKFTGSRDS